MRVLYHKHYLLAACRMRPHPCTQLVASRMRILPLHSSSRKNNVNSCQVITILRASEDALQAMDHSLLFFHPANSINTASAILSSTMAGTAITGLQLPSIIKGQFFSNSNILTGKQSNMSKLAIFAFHQN